jgi:hypothetical protein
MGTRQKIAVSKFETSQATMRVLSSVKQYLLWNRDETNNCPFEEESTNQATTYSNTVFANNFFVGINLCEPSLLIFGCRSDYSFTKQQAENFRKKPYALCMHEC